MTLHKENWFVEGDLLRVVHDRYVEVWSATPNQNVSYLFSLKQHDAVIMLLPNVCVNSICYTWVLSRKGVGFVWWKDTRDAFERMTL